MVENRTKIITRFAPSPTGDPHVGSLRNALYNWIFARQHQGKFILRIDDTDQARCHPGSEQGIFDMLYWVGLDFDDEFKQSDRVDTYQKYARQLLETGHAYYCFCTAKRLEQMRKEQQARKEPPRYDKKCRSLSEKEIEKQRSRIKFETTDSDTDIAKENSGAVVRFKIPESGETVVQDIVRGEVVFKNEELDDFVILKSDGFPTYHLASVVDDYEYGVTHVIRSEEWFSSFPKHVLMYQAMKLKLPKFAHLPLILAQDKSKLSKRHGATGVKEFKALGYLPKALFNYVLLLGWHPKQGSEQEIFSKDEILKQFSLDDVQKSGAIFDYQKLDWMNAEYIKNTDTSELVKLADLFLEGYELQHVDLKAAVEMEKTRIHKLSDLAEGLKFLYRDVEYEPELLIWRKSDIGQTVNWLTKLTKLISELSEQQWNKNKLESCIKDYIEKENLGTGDTLWPMRVSLTGLKDSPGPFEVASVLGKEESIKRIEKAISKLSASDS